MALHPTEEATLRAFVVPAKRDRLLALFGSAKRRKQARIRMEAALILAAPAERREDCSPQ
jgi:hypothetical protein